MTRRAERVITAIGLIVALFGVVPVALAAISRSRFGSAFPLAGVPPIWRWSAADIRRAAAQPLSDGAVADLVIRSSLVAIWLAIGVVLVTTAAEVIHLVRHRGIALPSVRGLGWAQPVARVIAMGLIAIAPLHQPRISLASTTGDSARHELLAPHPTADHPAPVVAPGSSDPAGGHLSQHDDIDDGDHVVRRGESVFSIASDLAGGDPDRTVAVADAILDANLGRTMPGGGRFTNPAYVEVGWRLTISGAVLGVDAGVPRVASGSTVHVVRAGETLSGIARRHLGDADDWPKIWEANAGGEMGGGRTFDDPDLILPGWSIEVPADPDVPPKAAAPSTTFADGADRVDDDLAPTNPTHVPAAPPTTNTTNTTNTNDAPTDQPNVPAAPPTTDTNDAPTDQPNVPAAPTTINTTNTTNTNDAPTDQPDVPAAPTTTSTTVAPVDSGADAAPSAEPGVAPGAPSPIRIEQAAMIAAGVLTLLAVRRRQRLRRALPRSRVPEPRSAASAMERRLRVVDPGERAQRVDVAIRAAASSLVGTGVQIGLVVVCADGGVTLRLTADASLPAPWAGDGPSWALPASTPIELITDAARLVGTPCVALAQIGVSADGCDVLADLEACPTLLVGGPDVDTDRVIAGLATALASSPYAEVAHLVTVTAPAAALLDHRNAHAVESADAALELATSLVGTNRAELQSSFELRSVRTGGEAWEPAVVLLRAADAGLADLAATPNLAPGSGIAIVAAADLAAADLAAGGDCCSLRASDDGWVFDGFGTSVPLAPVGLSEIELEDIARLLGDASDPLLEPAANPLDEAADLPTANRDDTEPFTATPHAIVVGLLGEVRVVDVEGNAGTFERSKTVELIAWLTTHRERSTRTAARTALWELDVRDATFANVVSEARRALARLVTPPEGEEWVARTLTEQLPLHDFVVTDAQLVEERLDAARLQPPTQAIDTLRPAVEMIRDLPFAGTSYLWPDAEGLTSSLVLLAIGAAGELAAHALSIGDIETVFWATGRGLAVLPGHEELIALRMRAHARAGDLAGVRHEWESYERIIVADAWSDGEPAPKLLELRRELLS